MDMNLQSGTELKLKRDSFIVRALRQLLMKERTLEVSCLDEERELLDDIKSARQDWMSANASFEFANDQEIVDYHIYNIKACQLRYEYLLKKAKEKGIKVETMDAGNLTIAGSRPVN